MCSKKIYEKKENRSIAQWQANGAIKVKSWMMRQRILEHASTATKTTAAATTTTTEHLIFKDNYSTKHHNSQNAQNNGRKFTIVGLDHMYIVISNHNDKIYHEVNAYI
jgi:hypothetical protein